MFFQISQNQVLRLEGIITEQFAAIAFAHSVIPGRIVSLVLVLLVCNRSTTALPDFSRYRFDELSPCLSVFASLWVCAYEMLLNKLKLLSLPNFNDQVVLLNSVYQLLNCVIKDRLKKIVETANVLKLGQGGARTLRRH